MDVVVISGIAVAVFLLSLMLGKTSRLRADRFLIYYLVFFIASQSGFYLVSSGIIADGPFVLFTKASFLLGGPMFFYYVYALTKKSPLTAKTYFLTLLPFLLYLINLSYSYLWLFPRHHIAIKDGLLYIDDSLSLLWTAFVILFILTDLFYLAWFYFLLRDYKTDIKNSLSSTDRVNLNWLNVLFVVWLVSALILFPFIVLSVGNDIVPFSVPTALFRIANVVFIFITGYYGFRQTTVFVNQSPVTTESKGPSYQRSGLNASQASAYHARLLDLMKEKKPYLDGELTAQQLSDQMAISVNYLSQILNQEQKQNFFDFVNSYRVKEVQQKMSDPRFRNFTLLAIALESGFNSKTSFNTIFKKFTGQTPSGFYRSLSQKTDIYRPEPLG